MKKYERTALVVLALLILQHDGVVGDQLSDYLWKQTEKYHQTALVSKFIRGIRNVSLDPNEFGAYNVQDAVYIYWSKKSIDIAANRTTDPTLHNFLQKKSTRYKQYYLDAFKTWHIIDASGIKLGPECQNYVNHLIDVAKTMDGIYLVTALIPCAKLWPWLGLQIGAESGRFGVYNKWVKENFNQTDKGYTEYDHVINEAFEKGKITREKALDVYTKSMIGEVEFFNSVSDFVQRG